MDPRDTRRMGVVGRDRDMYAALLGGGDAVAVGVMAAGGRWLLEYVGWCW